MLHRANVCKLYVVMREITAVNKTLRYTMSKRYRIAAGGNMVTVVKHRKVNIVVLAEHEQLGEHCKAGDIAILSDGQGWWVKFVGDDGHVDCYGEPFPSYNEALWSSKAAAEFGV
jgi:hypothetical protein